MKLLPFVSHTLMRLAGDNLDYPPGLWPSSSSLSKASLAFQFISVCYANYLLKTANIDWKQSYKTEYPPLMLPTTFVYCLVKNNVCTTVSKMGSTGVCDLIPCETLLKISVACLSFLPHVTLPVLVNKRQSKVLCETQRDWDTGTGSQDSSDRPRFRLTYHRQRL